MTIKERKTSLIAQIEGLKSEMLINKLESQIKDFKSIDYEKSLKPMSINEFNLMIDKAVEDHKMGNILSHDELINEVKKW